MNAAARAIWSRVKSPACDVDLVVARRVVAGPLVLERLAKPTEIYIIEPRAMTPLVRRVAFWPRPYYVMHPVLFARLVGLVACADERHARTLFPVTPTC